MRADGGLAVIKEVLGLMGFGAEDDYVRFLESTKRIEGGKQYTQHTTIHTRIRKAKRKDSQHS